jgi:hypothetical protein
VDEKKKQELDAGLERALDFARTPGRGAISEPGAPVCGTCKDTHAIPAPYGDSGPFGDGTRMCTDCPTPCDRCRAGGRGPYCASTPCACTCHVGSWRYASRRPEVTAPEIAAVLARAGLTPADDVNLSDPVVRALVRDAVREDRRWSARVKLLETRIDFAVDVMRGRKDGDL